MFKQIKYLPINSVLSYPIFFVANLYLATLKLEIENEQEWKDLYAQGRGIIFCSWHQLFIPLIRHFGRYGKNYPAAIMISQSRDGDIIASVARYFGWQVKRGSSSKGGMEALRQMIIHLQEKRVGAHILDGPRGPAGVAKPGIVTLAQESNALVVPLYVEPTSAWFFKSWDKMFLPKPFSRVRVIFDRPISMPKTADREDLERQRVSLQNLMQPHLVQPHLVQAVAL
jgi:lysophospholipid acyltransferase (LPLAT)-like uncharacterized protein